MSRKFLEKYYDVNNDGFIEKSALDLLMRYPYPGNIRELKSILQSAVNLARGEPIRASHLPSHLTTTSKKCAEGIVAEDTAPIKPLAEVEKTHILNAYKQTGNNKSKTARLLGIGLNTLRRKLTRYGIQ